MATFKPNYRASASIGVGTAFNSLASDTVRKAGAQTAEYDNSTNLDDDVLLSGAVKLGTSPTVSKQVDVWVVASKDGTTATYPDSAGAAFTASARAATWSSENVRNAGGKLLKSMLTDAVTSRLLEFDNESVAALFGGVLPQRFIVFVAHDSGVALDASAGFAINALGVQYISV